MNYSKKLFGATVLLAGFVMGGLAHASSSWPQSAVRIVVPFPPGGAADLVARLVGQKLSESTGQSFIVENRAGASGTIGAQTVARSSPDGATILLSSPAEVMVGKIAGQQTSYDPDKDLVPVTLVGETPLAIVTNLKTGITSFQQLLDQARDPKATISYGTPGIASPQHFAGESVNLIGKAKMLHVPYRGASLVTQDLMGHQIPVAVLGMPPVVEHHRAGKLKILAVTSKQRAASLPDVPSVSETSHFADYDFTNWFGVFVPTGTPDAMVGDIASKISNVLTQEDVIAKLRTMGMDARATTPDQFKSFLADQKSKYQAVQKDSGIRID
jgi:tripartite-type tricarboxylate transporter receptor subunit TctC